MTKLVLAITRKTRNGQNIALPYTTDDDALAAWKWLKDNGHLLEVGDRIGENPKPVRQLMMRYLKDTPTVPPLPEMDGEMARLFISHLYGAELSSLVHTLIEPPAAQ